MCPNVDIKKKPYPLFVFEGGEKCGKTTVIAKVASILKTTFAKVACFRDPGFGVPLSEKLREAVLYGIDDDRPDDMTTFMLYLAAKVHGISTVLAPALKDGNVVLLDRYYTSTLVYQGQLSNLDKEFVRTTTMAVVGEFVPDTVFVLDIPVEEAHRRRTNGCFELDATDQFETRNDAFHRLVRYHYTSIFATDRSTRYRIKDATIDPDLLAISIAQDIVERLALLS